MYRFFTKWLTTTWAGCTQSSFLGKKYVQRLLIYTCIGFILYTNALAKTSKVPSGDFFVESVEVVSPDGVQVDVQKREKLKKIASLPEKTGLKLPNEQLLQSASKRLLLQGYVVDIHIIQLEHSQAIKLQIRLAQKLNKIASITWLGIGASEEKELSNLVPCQVATFLTPHHKKETLASIKTYFKQKGFPHIQVALHEVPTADNRTNLCFTIKRGEKIYIGNVVCRGNNHLTSQELLKQMPYTKARIKNCIHLLKKLCTWSIGAEGPGHIVRFFTGTSFVQDQLEQDINWLKQHYYSKGFIDIAITYEPTYEKKGYVDILLKITEGSSYKLGHITWQGNVIAEECELNAFLGLTSGDIFDWVHVQKRMYGHGADAGIKGFYEAKGYSLAYFAIKPYKSEDDRINLVIELREWPQLAIHKIVIHKDLPINFEVSKVLQQNGLQKGETITYEKLVNARNSLMHTGLFIPEKIAFTAEQEGDNKVNLVCNLAVQRPQMGFSSDLEGWDGTVRIGLYNVDIKKLLQGKKRVGRQKLFFQFNHNVTDVLLPWRLPRLFSNPKSKFTFSFQDIINPFSNPIAIGLDIFAAPSKRDIASELTKGAALHVSTKWGDASDFSELHTELGWHSMDVENILLATSHLYKGNIKQAFLCTDYTRHEVNDFFYPTQGNSLRIGVKKSFNLSTSSTSLDATYYRLVGTYSTYTHTPPIPGLQRPFAVKWQCSAGLSSLHTASPMGRFFLGSPSGELDDCMDRYYVRLRGYHSADMPINDSLEQVYAGGSCFFMQNIELRYALEESIPSYVLLFVDFACASQSLKNPLSTCGVSLGIGFRTKTPLGILGFDLGWPLLGKKSWLPKLHLQFGVQL